MGRMAIISVLTLLFALSIIGYNMNRRASDAVNNYIGYYSVTRAHDIASSSVETYIRKLAENPSLPKGTYSINPIMEGSAIVKIDSLPGDTLKLTSIGSYNGFIDTVQNKLYPVLVQPPLIYGATTVDATNSSSIYMNGNAQISGVDTSPPGWAAPSSPGEIAGIAYNITPTFSGKGTSNVTGNPVTEQVLNFPDYTTFASEMIRLANVVYNNGIFAGPYTFGTQTSPQITYFTGNTTIAGNATGAGIMIVNGNLTVSGTVNFDGLMIVADSATVQTSTSLTGTVQVYGGIVVAGKNVSYTEKGTVNVYYSSRAISNIQSNMPPLKYLISDWWE